MKGRVLVGGGTGFIGREVVALFERLNYEVIVISRKKKVPYSFNNVSAGSLLKESSESRQNTKSWIEIEVPKSLLYI